MPRECVVEAAVGELGKSDPAPYWADTLPGVPIGKGIDWCGSFALWALHQAGLAVGVDWVLGKGFLWDTARNGWRLPITTRPEPGDIAYFEHLQHHAVIERVDGDELTLINGNGFAGAVTRSTAPLSKVTAVFSLAPLLAAEAQS